MARVVAVAVQTDRPGAVEARRATIAPAPRIVPLADVLAVTCDRRAKGAEERLNDGVVAAREILRGLGTPPQRLVEQTMPVRVVQGGQARGELCQEAREIGPARRCLEDR